MNIRLVCKQLGLLLIVLAICMVASDVLVWLMLLSSNVDRAGEADARLALFISAGMTSFVGGVLWLITRNAQPKLGRREALLLVALSWLIGAAFAAAPYLLWANISRVAAADHPFHGFVDCYFESMSGLTTTGATILNDIGSVPRSLLLWRSLTHWLGGIGIVVLFVAVLPSLGTGGKMLVRTETTGVTKSGLRPQVRDTARILVYIYLGMTTACILALRSTGAMDWFESICHTMSMVSTGGLSTKDASIGAYDSIAVDVICLFFMLTAGVNFALFHLIIRGRIRDVWKDVELRVYLILKVAVIVIIAWQLVDSTIVTTAGKDVEASMGQSIRYGSFQTIALHTGTGYVTADYERWPYLSTALLVGLMFIGGCAGSTAGGIKVIRLWVVLKLLAGHLEKVFRPDVVRPIRVGGSPLDPDQKLGALVYVITFFLLMGVGAFLLRLFETSEQCDTLTALSASLSTIANVGPGLHHVGPTETYAWFSAPSKLIMSVLMALGRLEIFAILVVLTPRFWRGA